MENYFDVLRILGGGATCKNFRGFIDPLDRAGAHAQITVV